MPTRVNTSYYGVNPKREHLNPTFSDGTKFDAKSLSAASWFFPLGTTLRVTNPETGTSINVIVRGHGPSKRLLRTHKTKTGRTIIGRQLDLTVGAYDALGLSRSKGVSSVVIEPVQSSSEYTNALGGL